MLFHVRLHSTHVCAESSTHTWTTVPQEQHRAIAWSPKDTRAASMHIRALGTNTSSSSVVSQFVRMLCYTGWCRVVHVVPRVAAMPARVFQNRNPQTLRFCTAAREHSSWHGTMLYWGGGLRGETNRSDVSCSPEPRPDTICPPVVRFQFCLALASTTLVPKHVSQDSGWILFAYVIRARACRCMRATPLCRLVKPRPRVLMVCGVACAYHADDDNKHDRDTSMCF